MVSPRVSADDGVRVDTSQPFCMLKQGVDSIFALGSIRRNRHDCPELHCAVSLHLPRHEKKDAGIRRYPLTSQHNTAALAAQPPPYWSPIFTVPNPFGLDRLNTIGGVDTIPDLFACRGQMF